MPALSELLFPGPDVFPGSVVPSHVLDDLRYSLAPISTPDLDVLAQALAAMYAGVEALSLDYVDADGTERPGWGVILDVDNCPTAYLPWLAQLVGETLPITATDTAARQQIRDQPNRKRGTPAGIIAAVRLTLSNPAGTVVFIERSAGPSPGLPTYGLTVGVRTSECPDSAATLAAIKANVPGGILVELIVSDNPVINGATRTINAAAGTIDFATIANVT